MFAALHARGPGARPAFAAALAAAAAPAQDAEVPAADREWIGGAPFWQWTRATGDWGGHRDWLEERGVEVGGSLTVDWAAAWHGGLRNRDSVLSLLDVNMGFDLEQLLGLPKTLCYFDAYQIEGRDPSDDVGDAQSLTNIQADDRREVAEFWIETWFGDHVRLKAGKIDYNSEFAFSEEGGEFVNSAAAISPTILGAPTYPDPAAGVNLFVMPSEFCYLGIGVFDGASADGIGTGTVGVHGFFEDDESDAYMTNVEVGTSWTGGNSWGSGRLAVGGWYHGAHFARFDGGTQHGTSGVYAVLDQRLWREYPDVAEDRQGIGLMITGGFADADVADISLHVAAGVTWTGALAGRDDDVVGLLVTHADLSDATGAPFTADETAFELLYKLQATPAFALKPELQFIVDPGGDAAVADALVGLLRIEITF